MNIIIDERVMLELTAEKHAEQLFDAVNSNRKRLSEFLQWVDDMQSTEDMKKYLRNCEVLYSEKKEVSFVIILDGVAVGRIGLHHWNTLNKAAAIGYWLGESAERKGIIIRSCVQLINYGFEEMNLNRIEIKCATGNGKSQAVPVKLKFVKEGILRKAEFTNGEFKDLYLYSMLKSDWKQHSSL